MSNCPRCEKPTSTSKDNKHRPFCSAKCKLIDFGSWANEENIVSRPIKSEDFYEDRSLISKNIKQSSIHQFQSMI